MSKNLTVIVVAALVVGVYFALRETRSEPLKIEKRSDPAETSKTATEAASYTARDGLSTTGASNTKPTQTQPPPPMPTRTITSAEQVDLIFGEVLGTFSLSSQEFTKVKQLL